MTKPTLILLAAALVAAAGGSAQQQQQKDPPKKKEYVGSETCAGCHEEAQASFKKNAHISLETNKKRGWQEKACESCHGPGSVHAETNEAKDILSPKQMAPAAVDALCLGCHKNQMTQVGRLQSGHARNAVACTSCHNVHKTGAESSAVQLSKASGINKNCAELPREFDDGLQQAPSSQGARGRDGLHKLPQPSCQFPEQEPAIWPMPTSPAA